MRREIIKRNKKMGVIALVLILTVLAFSGCKKDGGNAKTIENEVKNIVQENETNVENKVENTAVNQEKKEINNTSKSDTASSSANNNNNNNNNNNSSADNKAESNSELVVYREGMADKIPAKEYNSSMGYTIKYASEYFKVSYHDGGDWYEGNPDNNCVVVEKENVSYSQKIASISDYKKVDVNGYEAVYTTRAVEGQIENTYYVNSGKDSTYIITTSCQGTTDYLEGLGKIMDAMVQTFSIK